MLMVLLKKRAEVGLGEGDSDETSGSVDDWNNRHPGGLYKSHVVQ